MGAFSMDVRLLTTVPDRKLYEEWIAHHPDATLWQSPAWQAHQEGIGRTVWIYGAMEDGKILASALTVIDTTAGGFSTWDVPRGPLLATRVPADAVDQRTILRALLERMQADAKAARGLSIFLSPALPLPDTGLPLKPSPRHEQPEATRIVDLSLSETEILAQMHSKGRYNIKVAEKNGVRVEETRDTAAFAALMAETSARDGFRAPSRAQFEAFLRAVPGSFLLLAYAEAAGAKPVAGLLGAVWKQCGIYYYGASAYEQRALMAPYALQWAAMRRCKAAGCVRYDLLGVAPPDAAADHPWVGISGFKEKFGGSVVTYPQERRMTLRPILSGLLAAKRRVLG